MLLFGAGVGTVGLLNARRALSHSALGDRSSFFLPSISFHICVAYSMFALFPTKLLQVLWKRGSPFQRLSLLWPLSFLFSLLFSITCSQEKFLMARVMSGAALIISTWHSDSSRWPAEAIRSALYWSWVEAQLYDVEGESSATNWVNLVGWKRLVVINLPGILWT